MTILQLQDGLWKRCIVHLWELQLENQHNAVHSNRLCIVSNNCLHQNQADYVIVNILSIWPTMRLIFLPGTRYYHVNNAVDLVMFNCFWPKP